MKCLPQLLLALLSCPVISTQAATAVEVRLVCTSVRFDPATASLLGQKFSLALSTDPAAINGELALANGLDLPSHGSGFQLDDPIFGEQVTGQVFFDVPMAADANKNELADFFEVNQAVNATTTGLFVSDFDEGEVQAVWKRAAGSRFGTCKLTLISAGFGFLPEFTHRFELIEYRGAWPYTRSGDEAGGILTLAQTGNAENTFTGPIVLARSATQPLRDLEFRSAALTNAARLSLSVTNAYLGLHPNLSGYYTGFAALADGTPETPTADFLDWVLTLTDANDANQNGVPDLSDDSGAQTPPPRLQLRWEGGKLVLTLTGQSGLPYVIEQTATLTAPQWAVFAALSPTNTAWRIEIPAPVEATRFWRLRAP